MQMDALQCHKIAIAFVNGFVDGAIRAFAQFLEALVVGQGHVDGEMLNGPLLKIERP
jgi:hypothetical protein